MSFWYFPDNTVLCNFAAIARLDILEKTLASRGRWTEAVEYETRRSVAHLPALESVLRDGWLGDPIQIAGPHGKRQGIVTRDTVDVMREAVAGDVVTAEVAFDALQRMILVDRRIWRFPRRAADLV